MECRKSRASTSTNFSLISGMGASGFTGTVLWHGNLLFTGTLNVETNESIYSNILAKFFHCYKNFLKFKVPDPPTLKAPALPTLFFYYTGNLRFSMKHPRTFIYESPSAYNLLIYFFGISLETFSNDQMIKHTTIINIVNMNEKKK